MRRAASASGLGAPLGMAGAGLLLLLAAAWTEPERTAFAYLAAWAWCVALCTGALAWVMIHHLTGSSWFVVLRRAAENAAAPLPLLALLGLPLLAALDVLYPWAEPSRIASHHVREAVHRIDGYLSVPFFLLRALAYFALWVAVAGLLRRGSRAQEAGEGERWALRQRRLSAAAIPLFGLSLHFAAVDWLMSLEPAWVSSVFGVYVFTGGLLGALALLVLAATAPEGELPRSASASHLHGLGKLLLTITIFWAYIAFFQYFIVWIGNVPSEVAWYVSRTRGSWRPVAGLLVLGHFALPFFALLSRDLKRRRRPLRAVAAWLLAMTYVDVYWVVLPALAPRGWEPHWADGAALLGVAGPVYAYARWRGAAASPLAAGDPRFEASLRFETH